jgi:2-keto-4-pentenoate hydratase/2-oxohepta-3-ene-1,7-dioic acid hydratase in catechol pathway
VTKFVRFSLDKSTPPTASDRHPGVRYGVLEGETLSEVPALFEFGRGTTHALSSVRLLPPVSPSKIVCVGRNYADHAKELGNAVPTEPLIFLKPPSSLIAHGDKIVYPALSTLVSYEAELGVIIGRRARNVRKQDWADYVAGYTCVNDVTARDLQKKDGQWTRGKGFDTFCPVGQWAVPADEVRLNSLRVQAFLDGEKKQDGPVTDMIFDLGDILAYVSQFMTLEPGDLIATGTPPGVGAMGPGSSVRIVIDGVGALENQITSEA